MHAPRKAAVPLALAASFAMGIPAAASAKASAPARAAGGDVVTPIYPSLVQTRVDRAERALRHATKRMENNKLDKAAASFKVVRRQMAAAWRGAKYVIRTTPPPPATEDRVPLVRARASGGAPVGPTLASPADTGFLVLSLQHEVASDVIQLVDGAHGTGLGMLSRTLFFTLNRRDQAIQDILVLAPPAPPADDARVRLRAHASGGAPVVSTFDAVMPNVPPQLQDETQGVDGLKSDATDLTAGGRRLLNDAETQIEKTLGVVNTNWPPVPAED
jgi:hypothetical protein